MMHEVTCENEKHIGLETVKTGSYIRILGKKYNGDLARVGYHKGTTYAVLLHCDKTLDVEKLKNTPIEVLPRGTEIIIKIEEMK